MQHHHSLPLPNQNSDILQKQPSDMPLLRPISCCCAGAGSKVFTSLWENHELCDVDVIVEGVKSEPLPSQLAASSAYISLPPCLRPCPSSLHLTQSSCPLPSSFGRFPAHKVVLAAGSPHFRAMFTKSFLESRAKEVELHEITANGFQVRQQQHQLTHMASSARDWV